MTRWMYIWPDRHDDTSYLPMTLLAKEAFLNVAKPRSPILMSPVVPFMKILSHFKSLCMIAGVRVCRKFKPFKICLHQFFKIFSFTSLNLLRYLRERERNKMIILQKTMATTINGSRDFNQCFTWQPFSFNVRKITLLEMSWYEIDKP